MAANPKRGTALSTARAPVTELKPAIGSWLRFPEFARAPSPFDRTKICKLKVSSEDTHKAAAAGRRQPAFELWSNVLGVPPPVPGVEHRNEAHADDLTSLLQAHACFRGIERPLAEDNDGRNVIAYVLRPRFFYEYDPHMVSLAVKMPVPRDLLFVTYVRLSGEGVASDEPLGTITHWGFVEADPSDLRLPIAASTRYRERLW